ncbi:hypothetical protein GS454_01305 [Rhodococcus hoagii]|nr:hypothetical protein [Prescottella equi]
MTAPGATPPDNSFVVGSEFGQDITESTADALIRSEAESIYRGATDNFRVGILGGFLNLTEFIGSVVNKITGFVGSLDDLGDWFTGWNKVHAANAAKIAVLENRLANGSTFADDFNRPDNKTTLGNGWIQGGQGQDLGIIDNAARIDNTEGLIGVDSGRRYAICPVPATENDVSVSTVVNPKGVMLGVNTTLFLRANETLTAFAYAHLGATSVSIGVGTRSGNTWNFTTWKSGNHRLAEGSTIEFAADENVYRLFANGVLLLEHQDVAGAIVPDPTRRVVGFASETRIVNLLPAYSWGLAAFSHRPTEFADLSKLRQDAEDAKKAAEGAQGTVEDVQAAFGEYIAGQDAAANQGAYFLEDFSKLDHQAGLGPNFTLSTSGLVSIGANGAGYYDAGATSVTRALCKAAVTNDDHYARALLSTGTYDDTYIGLFVRGNDAMSKYVFARFYAGKIEVGTGAAGYAETVVKTFYTSTGIGAMIELRAVGDKYLVLVNSTVRGEVTITGLPKGESYRRTGLVLNRWQGWFAISYTTHARMFITGDYAAPTYLGTGWSFWRAGGVDQSTSSGTGDKLFGDTVFDQVGPETRNVKRVHDGAGIVEIEVSGWYQIDGRVKSDYVLTSDGTTPVGTTLQAHVNWINDSTQPQWVIARAGSQVEGGNLAEVSGLMYLQKGNRVRMGMFRSNGNMDPIGAPLGAATRFTGTLITSLKGARGETGAKGDVGPQGPVGEGLRFDVIYQLKSELPTTAVENTHALVRENGRIYLFKDAVWHEGPQLIGPKGDKGDPGDAGPANTLIIGSVNTGAPGSNASATITGQAPMQVLNLTIPQGPTGAQSTPTKVNTLPPIGVQGAIYWIEE